MQLRLEQNVALSNPECWRAEKTAEPGALYLEMGTAAPSGWPFGRRTPSGTGCFTSGRLAAIETGDELGAAWWAFLTTLESIWSGWQSSSGKRS